MTLSADTSIGSPRTDSVEILGVPVHDLTPGDVVRRFRAWLESEDPPLRHVVTVNPEFIMTARRDPAFHEVLRTADLATADGVGVIAASRLLGNRIRGRITGVELVEHLAKMSDPAPRLFLLGSGPGVASEAAARLTVIYPGVSIAGTLSGSPSEDELEAILVEIRESGANTLLVAFGAPVQEKWIAGHRRELAECGIVIAIGVGGTFDYLAGNVPRAPAIIRRIGFEWLYRLIRQPWRWRRQLALPHFVLIVLRERLFRKGVVSVQENGDSQH